MIIAAGLSYQYTVKEMCTNFNIGRRKLLLILESNGWSKDEHSKIHKKNEQIAYTLLKAGVIHFDKDSKTFNMDKLWQMIGK